MTVADIIYFHIDDLKQFKADAVADYIVEGALEFIKLHGHNFDFLRMAASGLYPEIDAWPVYRLEVICSAYLISGVEQ